MKFWVRINGLQEGPMEIDQLRNYNITPTTYVWCAGMKDWAYARDVEDLKDVIVKVGTEEPKESEVSDIPEVSVETPAVDSAVTEEQEIVSTGEIVSAEPVNDTESEPQSIQDERPCPSNNLLWAILATVFCCQFTGLIAIIYAAQVSNKYYKEGYDAAKKYSDLAGVWCIVSVVLAILSYSIFMPIMLFAPYL